METLQKIQQELKAPKGQYNSFAKYNYRSCEDILEAVKPLLVKYEATLVLHDTIEQIGERYYIKATADFCDKDGKTVSASAFAREPEEKRGMDEPQITGTASSYARKYALNGLFLIDDTKDADTDEYAKTTKKSAPKSTAEDKADYKLSFQEVREKLTTIDTLDGLNKYWAELHLSEKQANILKKDFADRKAKIGGE